MTEEIRELQRAMTRTGASKADMARVLGVSWQTFHRWTKGERRPSPVCRRIIRQALEGLQARPAGEK